MTPLIAITRSAVAGLAFSIGLVIGIAAPSPVWWDISLVALGATGVLWAQWLNDVIHERH